ncbi:MAG TPA: PilZ domain-containing protein [Candidatus Sulfotelmatobacter sp.]
MREPRTAVMTLVEVSLDIPGGPVHKFPARMEVRSANGACIRVKKPIDVGSKLRIHWRFDKFIGIVVNCRREGWEYLVGIRRETTNFSAFDSEPDQSGSPVQATSPLPGLPASSEAAQIQTVQLSKIDTPEKSSIVERKAGAASPAVVPVSQQSPRRVGYELMLARQKSLFTKPPALSLEEAEAPPPIVAPVKSFTKEPVERKEVVDERKPMRSKWLGMAPWQSKQASPGENRNRGSQTAVDNQNHEDLPVKKNAAESIADSPALQVELLPMEDIYRSAGILNPQRGYGILKVVDMLNSEHISNLPQEMKRAAVLMALDAAGIPLNQVQKDAKARENALNSYEASQSRQLEEEWARKMEQNDQIQAELETVKAGYMARIDRNLEGIAREKARFRGWVSIKEQETQSMLDAAELCLNPPVPERFKNGPRDTADADSNRHESTAEPAADSANLLLSDVRLAKAASAKTM